ncbi:SMP-30/gluconolactonase/LRE family protein [Candidatus Binatia bacterium]|nr:SMP-30/gluconolactonase/LRE family protein [Candidatus Binatia bacterium]
MTPTLRVLHEPLSYPEGPTWDAGRLYFVEYARHAVGLIDLVEGAARTVWQQPGFGPAAVVCGPDGAIWVTGSDSNCIARIARNGLLHETVRSDSAGRPLSAPNDLVFDDAGALYFTAAGVFDRAAPVAGGVFRHRPGGDTRMLAADIHYANGIALGFDGTTLFVSEHFRNRVLAFDVQPDGALRGRRIYADLHALAADPPDEPLLGPDGLACSRSGRLVVAQFGAARLLILGRDARLEAVVDLPFRYPTNVAWGEAEPTLYVTAFHANVPPFTGAVVELNLSAGV